MTWEGMDWINLAYNMDMQQACVQMVINIQVPWHEG
jgi:hypothetical protein